MSRRVVATLAAALLLAGACGAEEDPAPSIEEQAAADGDGGGDDGAEQPVAGTQVPQGTVTTLGDVRIGVYSTVSGTLAQVSIETPDETVENTELQVGDEVEVGGYTLTLTEAGSSSARMLVVDPDGVEVGR